MKKRILAVFLSLMLLFSAFAGLASVQADEVKTDFEVSLVKTPTEGSLGEYLCFETKAPWNELKTTFETDENGDPFIMFDRPAGGHIGYIEDAYGGNVQNLNVPVADYVGIILSVKVEKNQKMTFCPNDSHIGEVKLYNRNSDKPEWVKAFGAPADSSAKWEQYIDMPENFNGYVYISFDDYSKEAVNWVLMRFWAIGGEYGRVGVGNIYGVVAEPDYGYEDEAGLKEVYGEFPMDVIVTPEMDLGKVEADCHYKNFVSGPPWNVTKLTLEDVDGDTMVKYTTSNGGDYVSKNQWVGINAGNLNMSTSEYTGLVLYMKSSKNVKMAFCPADTHCQGIMLYDVNRDAGWTSTANTSPDYDNWRYWQNIPDNFEGYVYIPFTSAAGKDIVNHILVGIYALGGQYGDVYFGAIYGVNTTPSVSDKPVLNKIPFLGTSISDPDDGDDNYTALGDANVSAKDNMLTVSSDKAAENSGVKINCDSVDATKSVGMMMYFETEKQEKVRFTAGLTRFNNVKLLNLNETAPLWKANTAGSNSWVDLPDNFKGWVYIPFAGTGIDALDSLVVEFGKLGGDNGSVKVGQSGALVSESSKIPSEILDGGKVLAVIEKINAINLTSAEQRAEVEAVMAEYDALDEVEKSFVGNYSTLVTYIDQIGAWEAEALIDAIGEITSYDQKSTVNEARNAYNVLSAQGRGMVKNLDKLVAAEEKIESLRTTVMIGECEVMLLHEATPGGVDDVWEQTEMGTQVMGRVKLNPLQGFNGEDGNGWLTEVSMTKEISHYVDVSEHFGVSAFNLGIDSSKYEGFMIYIETGKTNNPTKGTALRMAVGKTTSEWTVDYARLYDVKTGAWTRYAHTTPVAGAVWEKYNPTPANFKGYLYIPFSDFTLMEENSVINYIYMHMSHLGGQYGTFKLGAVYGVVSATDKVDTVPVNTAIGDVYSELPEASTTDHRITELTTTENGVELTWTPYDNADHYTVEVYQNYYTGAATAFQAYTVADASTPTTTVQPLQPNMRYQIVVRAMGGRAVLATYEAKSFTLDAAPVVAPVVEETEFYDEAYYGELIEEPEDTVTEEIVPNEPTTETVTTIIPGKKGETKVIYVDVSFWELVQENLGLVIGISAAVLVAVAGIIVFIVIKRRNKRNA